MTSFPVLVQRMKGQPVFQVSEMFQRQKEGSTWHNLLTLSCSCKSLQILSVLLNIGHILLHAIPSCINRALGSFQSGGCSILTEELDPLNLNGFLVGEKVREFIPHGWLFSRAVTAFIWQVGKQPLLFWDVDPCYPGSF